MKRTKCDLSETRPFICPEDEPAISYLHRGSPILHYTRCPIAEATAMTSTSTTKHKTDSFLRALDDHRSKSVCKLDRNT